MYVCVFSWKEEIWDTQKTLKMLHDLQKQEKYRPRLMEKLSLFLSYHSETSKASLHTGCLWFGIISPMPNPMSKDTKGSKTSPQPSIHHRMFFHRFHAKSLGNSCKLPIWESPKVHQPIQGYKKPCSEEIYVMVLKSILSTPKGPLDPCFPQMSINCLWN